MVVDGKLLERSWPKAWRSPPFQDAKGSTAPHTELRVVADDANVYVALYVADVDIEASGDSVEVDVGAIHVVVTPRGGTAPPGVRVAADTDDAVDNPNDLDEEWTGEIAIPRSLLAPGEVLVRATRTDVGHQEQPHTLTARPATLRLPPLSAQAH
jgi:hypothetical protein